MQSPARFVYWHNGKIHFITQHSVAIGRKCKVTKKNKTPVTRPGKLVIMELVEMLRMRLPASN